MKSQGEDHRRKYLFLTLLLLDLLLIAAWCSSTLLMRVSSCLTSSPISQIANGVLPMSLVFSLTKGKKFDFGLLRGK